MEQDAPPAEPWTLPCPWCTLHLLIPAGRPTPESIASLRLLRTHTDRDHQRTWKDVLDALLGTRTRRTKIPAAR